MRQTIQFIKDNYGAFHFDCKQYDRLYEFMQHDKKNSAGVINFTLLKEIGDISINRTADKDTIFEMFDFYRECMDFLVENRKLAADRCEIGHANALSESEPSGRYAS